MRLLDHQINEKLAERCFDFLLSCFNSNEGGFAGGPNQSAHLAPTYAAVNSFILLSGLNDSMKRKCFNQLEIVRPQLQRFLKSLKDPNTGAFRVTKDGEIDTRGAYTAMAVASLLNINSEQLKSGVAQWLAKCQRFEGGLGGEPGTEAHGGYTFCGLAALVILGASSLLDLSRLLHWTAQRQMTIEGGFQGRTNKLVDGCYSFWVGAIFPILQLAQNDQQVNATNLPPADSYLFDRNRLRSYVVACCQHPAGGLKDKPTKGPDLYHTCYCLSGLAIADSTPLPHHKEPLLSDLQVQRAIKLDLNPIYNLPVEECASALDHFSSLPLI